MLNEVAVSPD